MSLAAVLLVGAAGTPPVFYLVFGVFLAAFVVLAVVTVRWAVRRDRAGRAEWVRRQAAQHGGSLGGAANGRAPSHASQRATGTAANDLAPGREGARRRRARGRRPRP